MGYWNVEWKLRVYIFHSGESGKFIEVVFIPSGNSIKITCLHFHEKVEIFPKYFFTILNRNNIEIWCLHFPPRTKLRLFRKYSVVPSRSPPHKILHPLLAFIL